MKKQMKWLTVVAVLSTQVNAMDEINLYVRGNIGSVLGNHDKEAFEADIVALGYAPNNVDVEDDRAGYSIIMGVEPYEDWSVELGYTDLGEVSIGFQSDVNDTASFFNDIASVHPRSAKGITLGALVEKNLDQLGVSKYIESAQLEQILIFAQAGLFHWSGDYETKWLENDSVVGESNLEGNDFYVGLGTKYQINQTWSVEAGWDHFIYEKESANRFFLGVNVAFTVPLNN